jgi:hypothetical protein
MAIDRKKIPNLNSIPKQAILEAIDKAGNCNRLAVLMECHNAFIHKILYKPCPRGKDLVRPDTAYRVQKAVNIKGLAERLCPSIKKIKKY